MKFRKPTIEFSAVLRHTSSKWGDIFVNGYRAGAITHGHGFNGWAFFINTSGILTDSGFNSEEVSNAIPEERKDGGYKTRAAAKKAFIKIIHQLHDAKTQKGGALT